jgi:hypothetical protein
MKRGKCILFLLGLLFIQVNELLAQNPIIRDQFSADPSARVFEGKVYLYPSHDIFAPSDYPRKDWFCMADYHVFSSSNLVDWTDHGIILDQNRVDWVNSKSYSMWAPDCMFKEGKYYLYFPAISKDSVNTIGVAVADKPYGPFVPQKEPITGVKGIDPNPFIDKDGQAYLYWAAGNIFVAKLKPNMLDLASEPRAIKELPKGFKEGPYLFERNGIYYLTYPFVLDNRESLAYSISDNPMGPFEYKGVIMDQSPTCWTNHHSIIKYNDQWYLFYHNNDLSEFDKNRSVRIDSLSFNSDGTIRKVIPTLRGVGLSDALQKIQIDRYSRLSKSGVFIDFIDNSNKFKGWKTIFKEKNAWVQYNSVNFGTNSPKRVNVQALSRRGGTIEIRMDGLNGPIIAEVKIPSNNKWDEVKSSVDRCPKGIHNLYIFMKDGDGVEIDWLKFEK